MRVKRGTVRHAKHKKIIKLAKGYQGRRKSVFKLAKQAVYKAGQHAYKHRRTKKRDFRALWIIKMNAGVRAFGLSYSEFINKLKENKIILNRKVLSDLAENHPESFEAVVKKVK
jgi:large subunit ribosomal protein L20